MDSILLRASVGAGFSGMLVLVLLDY